MNSPLVRILFVVVLLLVLVSLAIGQDTDVMCPDVRSILQASQATRYVYRTLKGRNLPTNDLQPLNPQARVSVVQHVSCGSTIDTQYLSTSDDLASNIRYCERFRLNQGDHLGIIVRIDLQRLPKECRVVDIRVEDKKVQNPKNGKWEFKANCMGNQNPIRMARAYKELLLAGPQIAPVRYDGCPAEQGSRKDWWDEITATTPEDPDPNKVPTLVDGKLPELLWAFQSCTVPKEAIVGWWTHCGIGAGHEEMHTPDPVSNKANPNRPQSPNSATSASHTVQPRLQFTTLTAKARAAAAALANQNPPTQVQTSTASAAAPAAQSVPVLPPIKQIITSNLPTAVGLQHNPKLGPKQKPLVFVTKKAREAQTAATFSTTSKRGGRLNQQQSNSLQPR